MSRSGKLSETEIRNRRRQALRFWVVCLLLCLLLALNGALGVLFPLILAFASAYMVFWNLLITVSGQKDPFDMSDLSPRERNRQHYAEDDEDHWKL